MTQDHTFLGKRGEQKLGDVTMADVYKIVRDRFEYAPGFNGDPDASAQNFCVELEKKMGIFPNVPDIGPLAPEIQALLKEHVFVRVYILPERKHLTSGYCFGPGKPITFTNVDWFECPIEDGRKTLVEFIKTKMYYRADCDFLVLGDHPDFVFRIDKAG